MMSPETIAFEKLKSLSLEHQQAVLDFIDFLQLKEQSQASNPSADQATQQTHLEADWKSDPFFGIWRDREDLKDSAAWVREIRQQHWNH